MSIFSRKQPTEKGGMLVKIYSDDNTTPYIRFNHVDEIIHNCPYCDKQIIESSISKDVISNSRIGEEAFFNCVSCNNEINIHYQWVCDPECESDGMDVYNLYTKEDYKDIYQ